MFQAQRHDFGTIARGAKAEYEFTFKNLYVEDLHVASVRVSCHCTNVSVKDDKRSLKTFETSAIVASINSGAFLGNRGATITVTFDRPFYAEVQLPVTAFIRSDIVVNPGSVQFASVDQGTAAERQLEITCPGGNSLQLRGVRGSNPNVVAKLFNTSRGGGEPSYRLQVSLSPGTPAGYLNDQLMLLTNDPQSPQIPVPVEGRVLPALVVSPNWLFMGVVHAGQKVSKQLVVQGKQPFVIKNISCDGKDFQFDVAAQREPKRLHVIPVTFIAGDTPGKISRTIRIETNLGSTIAELPAQAVVTSPEAVLAQRPESGAGSPPSGNRQQTPATNTR